MTRRFTLIGAPSSIGIRPYDDGRPRRLDLAPAVLRRLGLVSRLDATDAGDVVPASYRDFTRPANGVRNEPEVLEYSRALSQRVHSALSADVADDSRALVVIIGGDCSIVLGVIDGARQATGGAVGLAYVDAHADFATPMESMTGSAASMCLAMAVGRGSSSLAGLRDDGPLVAGQHVALLGRRDHHETANLREEPAQWGVLDLPDHALRTRGFAESAGEVLDRLTAPQLTGFWVHLDADVLDPVVMPSVDSPLPGGLSLADAESLLAPLLRHPKALGMHVSIYDPALDVTESAGANLMTLLERLLAPLAERVLA